MCCRMIPTSPAWFSLNASCQFQTWKSGDQRTESDWITNTRRSKCLCLICAVSYDISWEKKALPPKQIRVRLVKTLLNKPFVKSRRDGIFHQAVNVICKVIMFGPPPGLLLYEVSESQWKFLTHTGIKVYVLCRLEGEGSPFGFFLSVCFHVMGGASGLQLLQIPPFSISTRHFWGSSWSTLPVYKLRLLRHSSDHQTVEDQADAANSVSSVPGLYASSS